MAFQKKVLRKQGNKFQLVDKDSDVETALPVQFESIPLETQPERYESDHWEELRASIRKKYEAQKLKTRPGPLNEPRSADLAIQSEFSRAPNSVEDTSSEHTVLTYKRQRPAYVDDIVLEYTAQASHGSFRLRRVQSTGSINTEYSRVAEEEHRFSATTLDYRTFCRHLFSDSAPQNQSSSKGKVREADDDSHRGPRYQRRVSLDRMKRHMGFNLPDVPEVPEIPSAFRRLGRASSSVFRRSPGQSDIVIDLPKRSWPQTVGRSGHIRQEIPEIVSFEEKGRERDFSFAGRTRNSFAYDMEKKKERLEHPIDVNTAPSAGHRSLENTQKLPERQHAQEAGENVEHGAQAIGSLDTKSDKPSSYEARRGSYETKRGSSSSLQQASVRGRRASGRSSGDEPRILLNSGNIPFTPRRLDTRTSSHSQLSTHGPCSIEPPLKSILKQPGSAGSSSSNPLLEQFKTSPSPDPSVPSSLSQGFPFPVSTGGKRREGSQDFSSAYRLTSSSKSQQSLNDIGLELPLGIAAPSDVSEETHSTPQSESGYSEKTVISVKQRLEPRSPYANRPSPRSNVNLEDLDNEHSVNTSAALINILRAGPPPRFQSSENLPLEDKHRGRRPELNKKRSFKELCKDIVYKGQSGPPEEPKGPLAKPATISTQRSSKSSRRSRSLPRKVEEVFNNIGRNIKQNARMEDKLTDLRISGDNESQTAAAVTQAEVPIELQSPGLPQSSCPDLPAKQAASGPTCDHCSAKFSHEEIMKNNTLSPCHECGVAWYCTKTRDCRLRHIRACVMIQRPHTSYRMHSVFLPESLKDKAVYVPWQRGSYVKMQEHLKALEAIFTPQLKEGKGALMKEFRKELGWSKSMQNKGAKLPNDMLEDIYERFLRRAFMMPLAEPDLTDPATKHPNHKYHRRTAMLRCVECKGHCANCGVDCCVHRAIEMDVKKARLERRELDAMQSIKAEIEVWIRRKNPSIFAQCTECVADGKASTLYCPNCFGVCPLGQGKNNTGPVCGDILCAKHQSVLNAPCDWHEIETQPTTSIQTTRLS